MTSGVDLRGGLRFYRQLSRNMPFSRPSRILAESDSFSHTEFFLTQPEVCSTIKFCLRGYPCLPCYRLGWFSLTASLQDCPQLLRRKRMILAASLTSLPFCDDGVHPPGLEKTLPTPHLHNSYQPTTVLSRPHDISIQRYRPDTCFREVFSCQTQYTLTVHTLNLVTAFPSTTILTDHNISPSIATHPKHNRQHGLHKPQQTPPRTSQERQLYRAPRIHRRKPHHRA